MGERVAALGLNSSCSSIRVSEDTRVQ
jgi:hypothetical protein